MDVVEWKIMVNAQRVKLTPTEFRLLAILVENASRILTHQQLLERLWGWEYVNDLDYVRIYISHLRRKIERGHNHHHHVYIVTEPGVGYYFQKSN